MASLSSGEKLLHFRILNKIGHGGMGEVYLAEDQKLGRRVALKVLPESAAARMNARRRLLQEARSASALNHENIVTIHSIEEMEKFDFIVMEYVEGETLSSKLLKGKFPLKELLDINTQIAEGLSVAHDAGVIHRDIKSSNILITPGGKVKILDFGLAKVTSVLPDELPTGYEQLTEEGTILGTVSYMSPEQVRGEVLDSRSDIFSFGCVLYESATGRLPFRGPNPTTVMFQITNEPVIPASRLRDDLPAPFDAIILRALAKDKGFRYSSAHEMGRDLRSLNFPETVAISITSGRAFLQKHIEAFVGREMELQKLQDRFRNVTERSGSTIFLKGEPGIGKTSLAEEFLRGVEASFPNSLIARGRCVEYYGTGEAYLPFLDAIGGALTGPCKERLVQVLRAYAPTWCMQFPAAFASTAVLEKSKKEAADASKERMLREISDALVEFSNQIPLLLFLEDLHWADPSSADLLRYLSRRTKNQQIMILGSFREEDLESGNPPMKACRLDLQAHSISEELTMNLLTEKQIAEYLNCVYSPNTFQSKLASIIFQKTEGHPLFITSLTQYLVDQNLILKKDNVWCVETTLSESDFEMPENIRSMIRTKMESLSEEERRILHYASIEGEEFTSVVLSDLLKLDEIDLEERLLKIERVHRIIRKTTEEDWPDGSLVTKYRFVHALYQNAFYADIITKRKIQLHRLAGESLLKHYSGKVDKIANKLGAHFKLGRNFEEAIYYLSRAGQQAKAVHANAEAAELYRQALEQSHELIHNDAERWKKVAAELHENRSDALALLGKQDEAKKELLETLQLLETSDVLIAARVHRKIAKAVETQRRMDEALSHYNEAQNLLEKDLEKQDIQWKQEWVQTGIDKTWLYYTQNLLQSMQQHVSNIRPYVERIGTETQKVRFYQSSVLLANRRDRFRVSKETMEVAELSLKAADQTGIPGEIANATFVCGFASLWHGNLDRADDFLKRALPQILKVGDAVLQSRCLTYLAVLCRRRSLIEETKAYAEQSLDLSMKIDMQEYVAAAKANLGWVHWRTQEIKKAKELATEALTIWKSLPLVSPFQELALWPLISIAMIENEIPEAIAYAAKLLDPSQRRLDSALENLLESALHSSSEQAAASLQRAIEIVKPQGYL